MQDLQIEITRITGIRRLIDVIGIFAGLTALLFPMFFGIVFQPREHYFTSILTWNVSMGLLPIAFNFMVLSIALRFRVRDLKKIQQSEQDQVPALLQAYLTKIERHRMVLLTIGWLAVAKSVVEITIPIMAIIGFFSRLGEYPATLVISFAIQMGVTIAQGVIFGSAQFGLARLLKGQGLRLAAPKAEITTN